jgi:type I restriction enzyme R subunit
VIGATLPHASFIGTPIELQKVNRRAVFGGYISVNNIQRAVKDGATVPIHYERPTGEARSKRGRAAED